MKENVFTMKMRKGMTAALLLVSCCMIGLSSCEDDRVPKPDIDEYYAWGYFKGKVKNHEYSLESGDGENTFTISGKRSVTRFMNKEGKRDSLYYVDAFMVLDSTTTLTLTFHLSSGVQVPVWPRQEPGERIIYLANSLGFYTPREDDPFHVEVVKTTKISESRLLVEVKVKGTLYNSGDLKDPIHIDAEIGIRPNIF